MDSILKKIRQFIKRLSGKEAPQEDIFVQRLMLMLMSTEEQEVPCEEVYEVLDLYAEAVARGEDVTEVMPLVEHHLQMCGHCREEFQMLIDMVQYEQLYRGSNTST